MSLPEIRESESPDAPQVWRAIRAQISLGQMAMSSLVEVVTALRDLNAYDAGVLRAAAAALTPQVCLMSREQRQFWTDVFQEFKHDGDEEFLRALARGPEELSLPPPPEPGGKAARVRQVLCMLHGKQRSIDMMVDEGGGHYSCAPNRRCK